MNPVVVVIIIAASCAAGFTAFVLLFLVKCLLPYLRRQPNLGPKATKVNQALHKLAERLRGGPTSSGSGSGELAAAVGEGKHVGCDQPGDSPTSDTALIPQEIVIGGVVKESRKPPKDTFAAHYATEATPPDSPYGEPYLPLVPPPPESASRQLQHVFVMRHGERLDDVDPNWKSPRPFDPPLSTNGLKQAELIGSAMATKTNVIIHRAFTSPFLRCMQTASQVIQGLGKTFVGDLFVDNGLSEVCSVDVIRGTQGLPTDQLTLPLAELKLTHCRKLRSEVPSAVPMAQWGETRGCGSSSWARYASAFHRILATVSGAPQASPSSSSSTTTSPRKQQAYENVLLVTHGEAVAACIYAILGKAVTVYRTDYCCCAHFVREVGGVWGKKVIEPGPWRLVTECGQDGLEWIEG